MKLDWSNWLPPSLQIPALYWCLIICWSVGYFCRALPAYAKTEQVMQYAVLCAGLSSGVLLVSSSIIYGLGTGLIASTISMIAYDRIHDLVENLLSLAFTKILSFFGYTPPATPPSSPAPAIGQDMLSHLPPAVQPSSDPDTKKIPSP